MPSFSYKGYDFEVDHTPSEEEFAQMASHVDSLPPKSQKSSLTKAVSKAAAESTLPAIGGLGAAGLGAGAFGSLGTAIGGPVGGFVGAIGGGLLGGFAGAEAVQHAQDYATSFVPDDVKKALGFDTQTRQKEQTEHPYGSFAGSLAPNLLALRPGSVAPLLDKTGKVIMSSGVQRGVMGAAGAGLEAGQEYHSTGEIDPIKMAMAAALQAGAATPTRFGKKLLGIHGTSPSPMANNGSLEAEILAKKAPAERTTQGELFPETLTDTTGHTTPFDAGVVGTFEPTTPKRARAQMELPMEGGKRGAIDIDEAGVSIRPEDRLAVDTMKNRELARLDEEVRPAVEAEQARLNAEKAQAKTVAETARLEDAQHQLDLRKTAMEQEVAQRTSLEQGAAERARQEAGTIPVEVEKHPFVKAAEARVTKAEQLLLRLTTGAEEGHAGMATRVIRAKKDLVHLESLAEKVRNNVGKERKNPYGSDVVNMNSGIPIPWDHIKSLIKSGALKRVGTSLKGMKVYRAVAKGEDMNGPRKAGVWVTPDRDLAVNVYAKGDASRVVEDYMPQRDLYEAHPGGWVYAPEGTDISGLQRTRTTTFGDMSRAASKSSQIGGVRLDYAKKNQVASIKNIKPLHEMLPELTTVAETPEGVVAATRGLSDVSNTVLQKAARQFTKGFLFEKFKTNHPIVKYAYDRISTAIDNGKDIVQRVLQKDVLPKLRGLSMEEMVPLHQAMLTAMKHKAELSPEILAKHGFNDKQIATWQSLRSMFDEGFSHLNEARRSLDKPDLNPYVGYMAGLSAGDFKTTIVKTMEGKEPSVVGVIGGNNRWAQQRLVDKFLKEHPEYSKGQDKYVGDYKRNGRGKVDSLADALRILSDNNPDVAAFAEALGDHIQGDAYNYRGAKKHTMEKKNVFGMEGDKSWHSAEQNAIDGFKAQIKYFETMVKWGELSKAAGDLKKVLSDPEIQTNHPNAARMSKEYLNNALGNTESGFAEGLNTLLNSAGKVTGLGPSYFHKGINGVRGGINTIFFALKPVFLAANSVQGVVATPKMVNFLRSRGFDVAGLDKLGVSHVLKSGLQGLDHLWNKNPTEFSKRMWESGERYGISRSQLFDHSTEIRNDLSHKVQAVLETGMGNVEAMPRSMLYSMFSNILKDNGFEHHPDVFKVSRELTDMAMGDYRTHEAQKINQHFGPLAPLLTNLSTFAGNENSMLALLVRDGLKTKNPSPVIAAVLTGLAAHGLMGFPGFQEADQLLGYISGLYGKPTSLTNEVLTATSGETPDAKKLGSLLAMGTAGYAGIDLHNVLGRSSMLPAQLGGGGAGKAIDIVTSAKNLITERSEMSAKRLAYDVALGGMKGPMENAWFTTEDGGALDRRPEHGGERLYDRTKEDMTARNFGVTTVDESLNKQRSRQQMLQDMHYKKKQSKILDTWLPDTAVAHGGLTGDDVQKAIDDFVAVEGDPRVLAKRLKEMGVNLEVPQMTRYIMQKANAAQAGDMSAAKALQRLQEKTYGQ